MLTHMHPRTRRLSLMAFAAVTSSVGVAAVIWQWNARDHQQQSNKRSEGSSSGNRIQHMSARDFLQNKAELAGDEQAKALIEARTKSRATQIDLAQDVYRNATTSIANDPLGAGQFRHDVSKQGLIASLKMLLEMKQAEEDEMVKKYRQTGKYPVPNPSETFKRLQEEKQQVVQHVRELEGKRPYLWGLIWR